jgi:hypothetical protein
MNSAAHVLFPWAACLAIATAFAQPCAQVEESRMMRFYALNETIGAAYERGELDVAERLAREYLELAPSFSCDWNYGNAIHDGHRWLGLLALRKGDDAAAIRHLGEAGKSPGSPQLNSFGPKFDLAQALLERGHAEPVKAYLRDINRFWDRGEVDDWIAAIDRGERPHLDVMSSLPRKVVRIALGVLAWPALLVAIAYVARRKRITQTAAFFVIAAAASYGAMFLVLAAAALGMLLMGDPDIILAVMPYAIWVVPILVFLLPLIAVVLVARRFGNAAQGL